MYMREEALNIRIYLHDEMKSNWIDCLTVKYAYTVQFEWAWKETITKHKLQFVLRCVRLYCAYVIIYGIIDSIQRKNRPIIKDIF